MTTTEHHRHLAQGPRAYKVTGFRNGDTRLTSHTRLTYRQARWIAEMSNKVALRKGEPMTYVVERMAGSRRMDAMAVQA